MTITANGETHTLEPGTTLGGFLTSREIDHRKVVVERNGEALSPSSSADLALEDGDRLEIVRIVAGG